MDQPFLLAFPGPERASRHRVGGKGASLMRMAAAGLPVPPGVVLTASFFEPWFEAVRSLPNWARLTKTAYEDWAPLCSDLQEQARKRPLTATQKDALDGVRRAMASPGDDVRLAVRSSSPEEDLATASFAGGYETLLGVRADDLEEAVRACFASSLDVRVLIYKMEHGLDILSPRIAVVVQRQLASEISGVAFSLNPVTNDYDEAVIDANWGLGTSVVEGRVTPDHFIVDKVNQRVIESTLGDKHISVRLGREQGTVELTNDASHDRTLSDERLIELTAVVARIEELYEMPVDVEWAYEDGDLYVLQARPITTYVPLPHEMTTEPGQRRHLYADGALSKGLTINAPISPLGLDNMQSLFSLVLESSTGLRLEDTPPEDAIFFFAGGRMYVNYSNILWLANSRRLARSMAPTDVLMAEILAGVDSKIYRSATRPEWISPRLLGLIPRVLWNLRGVFGNVLRALIAPDEAYEIYRRTVDDAASDLRDQIDGGLPLEEFRQAFGPRLAVDLFEVMMPALVVGMLPPGFAAAGKGEEMKALTEKLTVGVTGNVVVEMGIDLYRLAQRLEPNDFDDLDALADRIERRRMSETFLAAWDDFMGRFGWRGPQEMDPASPRYADDPRLALRQMSYMAGGGIGGAFDPEAAHGRLTEQREKSYRILLQRMDPARRALLKWIFRRIDRFAGTRDTPKHLIVLFNYVVRKRALERGRHLAAAGRLDAAEDVFDLTFDDLKAAKEDPSLDLCVRRKERTHFYEKLKAHVRAFPLVIDSRGRILRPVALDGEDTPGVLKGMPVSSGVVSGPVKVLNTADEKPVEKGDVLVAYTTDPGWTPLFVNAAAIVLEVGGVLQHGAVVAREFGKPCVVGIDQVTLKLQDGELVEVDGAAGIVRRLS